MAIDIINNGPIGGFNPLRDLLIKFEDGSFNKLNRNGENNKYFLAYPPHQSDWYLIIFDSCNLKFTKKIKNIEIGLIGAGGGGGGHTTSTGSPGKYGSFRTAGAGGGAGGYKVTKMIETFEKDIYQLTIGVPDESYGNGGKTSIKNQLNTFTIEANGGLAGKNSTGEWKYQNGYGYEYRSAGAGGEGTYPIDMPYLSVPIGTVDSPSSASGGDGKTGRSNITESENSIPAAETGGYGKSLFTEGLFQNSFTFNNEIISDMIIVGAGGGGGGSHAYQYETNYKPYNSGSYGKTPDENINTSLGIIDAIYGRGGNGLTGYGTSIDPRSGGKGLIIIRHKKSLI